MAARLLGRGGVVGFLVLAWPVGGVGSEIASPVASSSLSDTPEYVAFATLASEDDDAFATFKSDSSYNVLEHLVPACGELYVKAIEGGGCGWFFELEAFRANTALGAPRVYESSRGTFSPTTLRYMKVVRAGRKRVIQVYFNLIW